MVWGNGNFEPTLIADGVIDLYVSLGGAWHIIVRTTDGHVHSLNTSGNSLTQISSVPVLDELADNAGASGSSCAVLSFFVDSEQILFQRLGNEYIEITQDVKQVSAAAFAQVAVRDTFFIKSDGSLWGMGENARGELGDGTRAPRNEPIQIADNVMVAFNYRFLKQDGTLWTWNQNDPTPQQSAEGVAFVTESGTVHFQDGRAISNFGSNNQAEFDNVRIPQTRTFN